MTRDWLGAGRNVELLGRQPVQLEALTGVTGGTSSGTGCGGAACSVQ